MRNWKEAAKNQEMVLKGWSVMLNTFETCLQVSQSPWRRKWKPTPVFLPGEFHGQGRLVGYSPWDHKESDMAV